MRMRRRARRRGRNGKRRVPWPLLLLAAGVFAVLSIVSEWGLSSVSEELTKEAARNYILECVNEAVNSRLEECKDSFVQSEKDTGGKIVSLSANAAQLNSLKAEVMTELSRSLNRKATAHVPVGSLTDVALLNGRGFQVPIKLQFEGSADVSFQSEFVSAGINQSCHRITMTVKASVYSQSKRFQVYAEQESSTVLAETVVVGEVPQLAAGLWQD